MIYQPVAAPENALYIVPLQICRLQMSKQDPCLLGIRITFHYTFQLPSPDQVRKLRILIHRLLDDILAGCNDQSFIFYSFDLIDQIRKTHTFPAASFPVKHRSPIIIQHEHLLCILFPDFFQLVQPKNPAEAIPLPLRPFSVRCFLLRIRLQEP